VPVAKATTCPVRGLKPCNCNDVDLNGPATSHASTVPLLSVPIHATDRVLRQRHHHHATLQLAGLVSKNACAKAKNCNGPCEGAPDQERHRLREMHRLLRIGLSLHALAGAKTHTAVRVAWPAPDRATAGPQPTQRHLALRARAGASTLTSPHQ
jgi:hypothetical protein